MKQFFVKKSGTLITFVICSAGLWPVSRKANEPRLLALRLTG